MAVIRSNYSTLSPYAQAEAPTAPEYPFTDMFNTYRRVLARLEDHPKPENRAGGSTSGIMEGSEDFGMDETTTSTFPSSSSSSSPQHQSNHTMSFQRILKHFFDDYFQRDADDETSADMAQRWVAFARTGDPNYEDSKVEWVPWRYIVPGDESIEDMDHPLDGFVLDEDFWIENQGDDSTMDSWEDEEGRLGRVLRDRALQALNMEVIEEDELRTELKRTKATKPDLDNPFFSLKFLSNLGISFTKDHEADTAGNLPREAVRQAQRAAQEMGVLGTGLKGDDRGGIFQPQPQTSWDDDFFPQLLELMWPPEGRLVERDCTCDFWDRIRCKSSLSLRVVVSRSLLLGFKRLTLVFGTQIDTSCLVCYHIKFEEIYCEF
jgi:hypothetical protein